MPSSPSPPTPPAPIPPHPPPPCCDCHIRHADRNKGGYLSCLDVVRASHLEGCVCAGDCPAGRCGLQCCVRSHQAGPRQLNADGFQAAPERRKVRKRPLSSGKAPSSPPHKRTNQLHHPSHDVHHVLQVNRFDVLGEIGAMLPCETENVSTTHQSEIATTVNTTLAGHAPSAIAIGDCTSVTGSCDTTSDPGCPVSNEALEQKYAECDGTIPNSSSLPPSPPSPAAAACSPGKAINSPSAAQAY
jgi:hypothetical protein